MIVAFVTGVIIGYRLRRFDHYIEALARAHAEVLHKTR